MKALILAGGTGTRLRPITHTGAKQLVPVANKPILFYGLEHMAEAGIREVGIIVGDTHQEIRTAVGSGDRWGLEITYIRQKEPLGLAHCVLISREFLGEDDFVMYLGDNLLRQGVRQVAESFRNQDGAAAQILLAHVPNPSQFGVVELNAAGEVVRLVEKPADPPSDLALVGVYLFDPSIHEAVRAVKPSWRGELEITDAIQWLIDHGRRVRQQVVEGWWIDTGNLDALLEGNRLILETLEPSVDGTVDADCRIEGRVVIQKGADVVGSTIRGPAIIGEGTRVEHSFVGPFTSIHNDCEIVRSEIEHSVILEQSRVVDIPRMEDSLVGRQVSVLRTGRRPRANRLMLGDHSIVDLT